MENSNQKWTPDATLGKIMAKRFNEAVRSFKWQARTIREVTDYGQHDVTPMFGGQSHPEASALLQAIHDKYASTVTAANYAQIINDVDAATDKMKASPVIVDKRTSPEERAERERANAEREAKTKAEAERIATFKTHEYGLTETATAIKRVLGVLWPATKFSVRSESFSGGTSITSRWTDGPTEKQVRRVMDTFQTTHFDGMQDLEYRSGVPEWKGHRFVFRSGYCSQARDISTALYAQACSRFENDTRMIVDPGNHTPCGFSFFPPSEDYPAGCIATAADEGRYSAQELVAQIARCTETDSAFELNEDSIFGILIGEIGPPEPTPSQPIMANDGVTVSENTAKDGVEVRFAQKPDRSVLDSLKARGWRWSRFGGCWYHKHTPAALDFAHSLTGGAAQRDEGLAAMTDVDTQYEDACERATA